MEIQLIRNATLRLEYGDRKILIDPFLAPRHSIDSFAEISPNPLTDLPCDPEEVISEIDLVIVSHLHPDHFDEVAQQLLPKQTPLFCQPGNEKQIEEFGFENVTPIADTVTWEDIQLTRTPGQHGTGEWGERMGPVSGFMFRAAKEPTLYWTGDTIWYAAIEEIISEQHPDVIVTHSGGARFGESDPIIMDGEQTIEVCQAAADAKVVAVHLESLDHCTTSRAGLRAMAQANGVADESLLIPADGETLRF